MSRSYTSFPPSASVACSGTALLFFYFLQIYTEEAFLLRGSNKVQAAIVDFTSHYVPFCRDILVLNFYKF
jgi:hypothetical protein